MKKILWIAALAGLLTGAVAQGAVLYQSDFTGADLASAGWSQATNLNCNVYLNTANDRVQLNMVANNSRVTGYTTNKWQNTGGFKVDVTFKAISNGNYFSFGLVDSTATLTGNSPLDPAASGTVSGFYSIGFETAGFGGTPVDALLVNRTNAGWIALSSAQGDASVNTEHTLSFSITSTNYSYSLDGAAATTGSTTFDLSKNFRFYWEAQRIATANPDGSYISNVTVSSIPEPATLTYTLTYTAGANGTLSGTATQTVNYAASGTAVTAVPDTGYEFVNWSDGSTANPRTDTGVTSNIAVTANFAISPSGDIDSDGLPNSWETSYFGGPTNANPANLAANGINTIYETYIAGLNPTNAQSVLTLSIQQNAAPVIQWSAASGRVYSVYWTSNLFNNLQLLATNIVTPQNSWTDQVHGAKAAGFYQIKVEMGQ